MTDEYLGPRISMPSRQHIQIVHALSAVLRAEKAVTRFYDEPRTTHVDILACADRPTRGVKSYSTVGLSDEHLFDGTQPRLGVELLGACYSDIEFSSVLATMAFCIIKDQWTCRPGAIFPDVVAANIDTPTMRHALLIPPFLWDGLEPLSLEDRTVEWLQAIPISEAEAQFARSRGSEALEDLFDASQIDVYDLARPSVAPQDLH